MTYVGADDFVTFMQNNASACQDGVRFPCLIAIIYDRTMSSNQENVFSILFDQLIHFDIGLIKTIEVCNDEPGFIFFS